MFGSRKAKQANVLSHWYTPVPNFNMSTQAFYNLVEKELYAQQVPGLKTSRVEFSEGGLFSAKRQYLRLTRERLAFDVCAAPFGVNYFFSCRFAELPPQINLFGILLILAVCASFFGVIFYYFDLITGLIISVLTLLASVFTLKYAASLGLVALETALLKSPLWGPIYERLLRKESYYREDTRLMYLTVVEGVVKKLVEQETAAKGVRLLSQYEYAPILGEMYRPKLKALGQDVVEVIAD